MSAAMINASELVITCETGRYLGIPYSQLDCQAFVERVLKDSGVRDDKGKAYNWRGSNHIWREAVHDRAALLVQDPPAGCLVFTIKADGGEKARGYHDSMLNAAHVGIYLGDKVVMHSTTGGVQIDSINNSKRWTHYALLNCVHYPQDEQEQPVRECCCCPNKETCPRWGGKEHS